MSTDLLSAALEAERRADLQADARREAARAAKAAKLAPRDPFRVEGAALAREIRAAILSVPAARRASEHEQDALAQMVAARLYAPHRQPRASAAQVLAWIDRAERQPLTAARIERERVERGAVGRRLLTGMIESACAQSREWLDTTDRFRTRAESQADTGPRVTTSADPTSEDMLTGQALAHRADPELAPLPEDSRELAQAALAGIESELAERQPAPWHLTPADSRRVLVALLVDVGGCELAALAAEQDRTLNALAIDRTRGGALLRTAYPDPAALVALLHRAAESAGLVDPERGDRPALSLVADAARRAIEHYRPTALYRAPGKRDPDPRVSGPTGPLAARTGARALVAYLAALDRPERPYSPRRLVRAQRPAPDPVALAAEQHRAALSCWAQQQRSLAASAAPRRALGVVAYLAAVAE